MSKTDDGLGSIAFGKHPKFRELKAEDVVWIGGEQYIVTYDEQDRRILKRIEKE